MSQYFPGDSRVQTLVSYQFSIAERMDAISTQRFAILGPSKLGDRVALDRSGNAQFGAFIHSYVTHGTSERGSTLFHALLHPGLDGHVGVGPGHTFIAEGNSRVGTFVCSFGGFED